MAIINSVLGPIDTKNLVFALMHEQVMSQGLVARDYPELFAECFLQRIVEGVAAARQGGDR